MTSSRPNIKVCHMASGDLWAGAEIMVAVIAEALVARPECEIHAIVLNPGCLQDRLSSLGIPVRVLPESELGPVKLLLAMTRELREAGCDILHTHRYKENILGTLAASYAGVPVCIRTIHGSPEPFRGLAWARMAVYLWLDRLVQRHLNDRVIVVADYLKSEMNSWLPEEKLVVIHNGLPERNPTITGKRSADDEFIIGWAGRMVPAKSLDALLHAVARLRLRLPSVRLRVAGDGPDAERLNNLVITLGLKDLVEFCGFVTDMSSFLGTLDVFVLPSRQEGLPVSLLEAMRAGVPVVASAVGGIPEVITHRRNGMLVSSGDANALSAALEEIATDSGLCSHLRTGGKATVSSRFSSEKLGTELVSLYTDLLFRKKQFEPITAPSLQ